MKQLNKIITLLAISVFSVSVAETPILAATTHHMSTTLSADSLAKTQAASSAKITPDKDSNIDTFILKETSKDNQTLDTNPITGALENFPTRKVTILPTYTNGVSNSSILNSVYRQTKTPFRYPYYEVNQTVGLTASTEPPTINNLETIARETNSDIVIAPVLENWNYYTFHRYLSWFDDDETYVYASAKVSLYSYNKATASYRVDSASYYNVDDYLTVPSAPEVLQIVMDRVLKKLPYKRIPTDIPRYKASTTNDTTTALPVVPSAVDSPYPLPTGIQQF